LKTIEIHDAKVRSLQEMRDRLASAPTVNAETVRRSLVTLMDGLFGPTKKAPAEPDIDPVKTAALGGEGPDPEAASEPVEKAAPPPPGQGGQSSGEGGQDATGGGDRGPAPAEVESERTATSEASGGSPERPADDSHRG
jgi:hypothetical protein